MRTWAIHITDQADADMREIYAYIAFELCAPDNARAVLDRIETAIAHLREHPQIYAMHPDEPWHKRGLHRVNAGKYAIFYLPRDHMVTVLRVAYGGRNMDAVLGEIQQIN